MKSKFFLGIFFAVFFLILVCFAAAELCENVGEIDYANQMFCNSEGVWQILKEGGESCLNNYECLIGSCVDGFCQSKYGGLEERGGLLDDVLNFFSGKQCDHTKDTGYYCEGRIAYLCGANDVWERKGEVPGQCGVESSGNGNRNGNGGGGCTPLWRCTNWSNQAENCGTRNCTDVRGCGKTYNKPAENANCPGLSPRCGDGVCDAFENENTCSADCKPIVLKCGNGICDDDESSATCPKDCPAKKRRNLIWLFWLLVVLIISAIGFVGFLLYRKIKSYREGGDSSQQVSQTIISNKNFKVGQINKVQELRTQNKNIKIPSLSNEKIQKPQLQKKVIDKVQEPNVLNKIRTRKPVVKVSEKTNAEISSNVRDKLNSLNVPKKSRLIPNKNIVEETRRRLRKKSI